VAATIVWSELAVESLGQIAALTAKDSPHFAALTVSRILIALSKPQLFHSAGGSSRNTVIRSSESFSGDTIG